MDSMFWKNAIRPNASLRGSESVAPQIDAIIAAFVVLLAIGAAWIRLFFGVDFTDEAYYVALPYRFMFGDQPFVDEINVTQTMGLITYPIVRLFVGITGGTEGIILFARFWYFLFTAAVGGFVFFSCKNFVGRYPAMLLAVVPMIFVPVGLPALSYNTMGMGFFSMGLWWFLICQTQSNGIRAFALIGVLHGMGVVAYPPFLLADIAFFLILLSTTGRMRWKAAGAYLIGALVIAAIYTVAFRLNLLLGAELFLRSAADLSTLEGPNVSLASKFTKIWKSLWEHIPVLILVCLSGALILASRKGWARVAWIVVPILIHIVAFHYSRSSHGGVGQSGYLISLALVGPLLFPLIEKNIYRVLMLAVWVPAFLGGVVMAVSSSNGIVNMAYGMFPAAIVSATFLFLAARASLASEQLVDRSISLLGLFAMIGILLQMLQSVGADDRLRYLTKRVPEGPFKGLYTTQEKYDVYKSFEHGLHKFQNDRGRVLFFPFFPAGYLMTTMRSAAPSVWASGGITRTDKFGEEYAVDYYKRHLSPENVVVELKRIFYTRDRSLPFLSEKNTTLTAYLKSVHPVVYENDNLRIYKGNR